MMSSDRRYFQISFLVDDKVEIAPNHGCTTINLHDEYHVVRTVGHDGVAHDGVLEAIWPIVARGKVR